MRFRSPSRPPAPVPISDAIPGRRGTGAGAAGSDPADPGRPGGTAAALLVGIVLMAAALLLPSSEAPDALPADALQPVIAATTPGDDPDADGPSRSAGGAWAGGADPTSPGGEAFAEPPEVSKERDGSSAASVAGADLDRAASEEAERRRVARRKAKNRRAARATARARSTQAPSRHRVPRPTLPTAQTTPPAQAPQPATTAAPPVPRAPAQRAAPRRDRPENEPAKEFAGGL